MKVTIDLDLDASNKLHTGFLAWYESNTEQILQAILCGYSVISSGILDNILIEEGEKENEKQIAAVIEEYQKRIEVIRKGHQDDMLALKTRHASDLEGYKHNVWIDKYEALSKEYNEYIKQNLSNQKDKEIQSLKIEIVQLKNSNMVKGNQGEQTLFSILTKHFTNYEIVNTSAQTSMSDIHMIDKNNNIIAIESKNKAIVTAQDVAKSLTDIKTLNAKFQDKFIAYLFVSIRSSNIPKKGDLYFEIVENKPVIWYGCSPDSADCLEMDVVKLVKLLTHYYSQTQQVNMSPHINSYLTRISETKKNMEQIINAINLQKTAVYCAQQHLDYIYDDMVNMLGYKLPSCDFKCEVCGQAYKRRGDLLRHIANKHAESTSSLD